VELKGQMEESAFEDPPWLIDRNGRYVQVPSLLYAVAERADGSRSLAQIAQELSAEHRRDVTTDNVRDLAAKLTQLGIIATTDRSGATPAAPEAGRSPLAVNMRMAMMSPRLIDPATAILQVLFFPLILVGVLAAAAVIHGWLYFVHGLGAGIHDAFYTPGRLLAVLLLVVLAAAFHEFGHAAALRYGGGKVRGMGVGFYLAYPAFYTDVTENYRLPRWARVRTDLGGFYFNLLFALALFGLYLLSGAQEFFVLTILLIDLEIIHQLLPFVRLDGYWALADMTGIPDFFSQIGPFLRSVLPSWIPLGKEGRKLPRLKSWAKVFFAGYILVTVPLLLVLLVLTIKAVPRILATSWDAFWEQLGTLGGAFSGGDWLLVAATGAQMIILTLPVLGLAFMFWSLGKRLAVAIWNWSKPTPARRVVGALGSLAAAAVLVVLWLPEIPLTEPPVPGPLYSAVRFEPIRADERFTVPELLQAPGLGGSPTTSPGRTPQASPSPTTSPARSTPTAAPTRTATPAPTTTP